ncbi:MAG: L-erythro-3,5-diaminohexanoate dehydrogenase [Polyangiaceae bacterium]
MEEAVGGDPKKVGDLVLETVAKRGKQHNPVTGSGGMLLGKVKRVGELVAERGVSVGDRVATLASLSLTPLKLERVIEVRPTSAQVDVVGTAIIFATAPFAKLSRDLPERLALAALDVAGAAPQVARLVKPGNSVLILGAGGKSGVLCAVEARRRAGKLGRVIGLESHAPYARDLLALNVCDAVIEHDARDVVGVRDRVAELTAGEGVDVTFSCVNVPGCEMSAIVSTKDRGKVYFFAMSTSFTACALGAEGIGADVDLFIGNGYADNHAAHTLDLIENDNRVRGSLPTAILLSERSADSR